MVPRALYDSNQRAWWALVDSVKKRARHRCEWCQRRPAENTHHRYGYGSETTECLMAVCRTCHLAIHGRLRVHEIVVNPGSLADRGDRGIGNTSLWRNYLGDLK